MSKQQCVLEHAAGQCDGLVARVPPYGEVDDQIGHGAVELRADHRGGAPARRSSMIGGEHRTGVDYRR